MQNKKMVDFIKYHLKKHKEQTIDKRLDHIHNFNHKLFHLEEIVILWIVAFFSVMLANYSWVTWEMHAATNKMIESNFQSAILDIQQWTESNKIISQRTFDSSVKNRFYPWYCTYFAALITPELFTYVAPNEQVSPIWWNAKERCENAQNVWIPTGSTAKPWSLVIYKWWDDWISPYGHVWRVMYVNTEYNKMIVRDWNYIGKYIATDRREELDNEYIKCYIYPPKNEIQNPEYVTENLTKPYEEDAIDILIEEETEDSLLTEWLLFVDDVVVDNSNEDNIVESDKPTITVEEEVNNEIIVDNSTDAEDIGNKSSVNIWNTEVSLDTSSLSPELAHFLTQYNLKIETNIHSEIIKWSNNEIMIKITKKDNNEKFSGILPDSLNFITSNNKINLDYNTLQLIYNWEAKINISAEKTGNSAIIINFWTSKIGVIKTNISK